jgi:hypothetical protein
MQYQTGAQPTSCQHLARRTQDFRGLRATREGAQDVKFLWELYRVGPIESHAAFQHFAFRPGRRILTVLFQTRSWYQRLQRGAGGIQFDDSSDFSEPAELFDREPLELRLVRSLWNWCDTSPADVLSLQFAIEDVECWLDGFIEGVLRMNESSVAASLCTDGVSNLVLKQLTAVSITAAGAIVWFNVGPGFYGAPFECDFYFESPSDPTCSRIIVRFGERDAHRQLVRLPYCKHLDRAHVVASRPRSNDGWAFALEHLSK